VVKDCSTETGFDSTIFTDKKNDDDNFIVDNPKIYFEFISYLTITEDAINVSIIINVVIGLKKTAIATSKKVGALPDLRDRQHMNFQHIGGRKYIPIPAHGSLRAGFINLNHLILRNKLSLTQHESIIN
jgi:hypothetical protein